MNRKLGLFTVLFSATLVASTSIHAQTATLSDPTANPASGTTFAPEKLQKIDSYLEQKIDDGKIVGCDALIEKDGKVVYHKQFGLRDRKESLPVEQSTIWRIYSMSKPITSVAVMQLVESDKLELDKPVSSYLPEFKNLKVHSDDGEPKACDREMTVRDLLRHTSGLTYGFFGNSPVDVAYRRNGVLMTDKNLAQTVTKLSEIPLLHQPGKRWHYSVSTDVLGRVVEVASGKSYKDYLNENIFEPLEMDDTFFSVPKSKQNRFAELYMFNRSGELKEKPRLSSYRFFNETEFYSGGGGLCSTTDDYLKFARMLLNGGELNGKRILKSETINEMTKNQIPQGAAGRGFQFGLGFRIDEQGHYSWGGAAGTRFWVDPKNKMITVFMIQINPYKGGHGKEFKKLAYEALK